MPDNFYRILLPLSFILLCLYALYNAVSSSTSLNGSGYLAAAIFLEILVVALWDYRRRFFPFLLLVFLFAGMDLPLNGPAGLARWLVLALGAMEGFVIYLRDRDHFFGAFDLVGLFCVIAALASAMVSSFPRVALLKTLSLLLMFLYAAAGARIAVVGREAKFFSGLVLGCEALVYFSATCYFILHIGVFGNPNSLGALMGIVATPVLLWGVIVSEGMPVNRRRTFALVLCLLLLLSSYARAAIVAGAVSGIFLCVALRRYRLLVKGVGVALLGAVAVAAAIPVLSGKVGPEESFISVFLYKGHEDAGIMGSRKTPWEKTSSVIAVHPWFGGGFGTSVTASEFTPEAGTFSSTVATSREHGNSYMALLEWVGLLGMVPFAALIFMVVWNVRRVAVWMLRTGSPFSPAVPLAAVLIAGLVHAAFEDWLFGVGYYLCVFFWALAFVLADVLRSPAVQPVHSVSPHPARTWASSYGIATSGR